MNISPELIVNNSINESLEFRFVEENWKTQSKFLCPKGRQKKSGKEPIFKNIFNLISFVCPDSSCLTVLGCNIAKYFKLCFPRLQVALTPIHSSPGCIFIYRVLRRRV